MRNETILIMKELAYHIHKRLAENTISLEDLISNTPINIERLNEILEIRETINLEEIYALCEKIGLDISELILSVPIQNEIEELNRLFPFIRKYQALAERTNGINDIFQDNNGKLLQTLLITGLKDLEGREGNDAIDENGNEFELKSVNIKLTKSFSTHHHLNKQIIEKYRQVAWVFSIYEGIELIEIYKLNIETLEQYFQIWEEKLNTEDITHINNPKIPVKFVRDNGILIYERNLTNTFYVIDINNI